MTTPPTDYEKRQKVREIVNSIHTAFMVTKTASGQLHGRPMATAEIDEPFETIWFATQRDSAIAQEIGNDAKVLLGYVNTTGSEWATVRGRGEIVTDRVKAKELWNSYWKNWFTGPEDPNLVLVAVTPESAEYWDGGSSLLMVAKFAFAAVTGKSVKEGEHGKVEMPAGRN